MIAKLRKIGQAIRVLIWCIVSTIYCEIVKLRNRIKRLVYCYLSKMSNEWFENTIDYDETTVEFRHCTMRN